MRKVLPLILFLSFILIMGPSVVLGDINNQECGNAVPMISVSVTEGTDSWGEYWQIHATCDWQQIYNACERQTAQVQYWFYQDGVKKKESSMISYEEEWPKATWTSNKIYSNTISPAEIHCHVHFDGHSDETNLPEDKLHDADSGKAKAYLCDDEFVNDCDIRDGGGCTRNTAPYNACDLDSDTSCEPENKQGENKCSDGYDNDCDGLKDYDDTNDCIRVICDENAEEGDSCQGSGGDLESDVNDDGFYCDTDPDLNRCCPVGEDWSGVECVPGAEPECNPDPCPYDFDTERDEWWGEPGCYSFSNACCKVGVVFGQEQYEEQDIIPY